MASAPLILFLGCWLAVRSGVSGPNNGQIPAHQSSYQQDHEGLGADDGTERNGPDESQQPDLPTTELEGEERNGPDESQQPDLPTTEPAGDERNGPDESQQPDLPTTEPAGDGETNMTQSGKTPAPTRPGNTTGLVNKSGDRNSTSTPPGTGGTNMTQSWTTPAPTRPGSTSGLVNKSGGRKSPSTPPGTDAGSIPARGADPIKSGTTPDPTCPCSTSGAGTQSEGTKSTSTTSGTGGSGSSAGPVLTHRVIAWVSVFFLLLLLLLAFACYRRTRGRKGPVPGQSRESQAATTVYALVGEPKQLDVPPQGPDPGAEGHTYAELDGRALQDKQEGPAPAPEPALYATINVSQGPDGQSPQDAGAPPPP